MLFVYSCKKCDERFRKDVPTIQKHNGNLAVPKLYSSCCNVISEAISNVGIVNNVPREEIILEDEWLELVRSKE